MAIGSIAALLAVLILLVATVVAGLCWRMEAGRPRLTGTLKVPGLSAPLTIVRDSSGVPTINGVNRSDVAFATGYLHAQERFFQMDQLRRAAAGELGALFGEAAREYDESVRTHRFRARARNELALLSPEEREMLNSYVRGVNEGLGDLGAAPFEYMLLRASPKAWTAEDSILVVYAMYLNLQDGEPKLDLRRGRAARLVGLRMADFLYPIGTELDAPIDGSLTPHVPTPQTMERGAATRLTIVNLPEPIMKGSNAWAVAGRLTATGSAMVANDMHLDTMIPNTWYRVRLVVRPPGSSRAILDIVGVTLPGMFPIVSGSNGFVAWGLTASYMDVHDAVELELVPNRPEWYRTPRGPRPIRRVSESICASGKCTDWPVRETIWGPVIGRSADGSLVVDRWAAHDAGAVKLEPMLALESAKNVGQAIEAAHRAALPNQNLIVGDREGNIGWTIMGRVPRRIGIDGRYPASWADGTRGWAGYLTDGEIPKIVNPASGRLWSANNRMVGGKALALLGDGGLDDGSRALRIASRLFQRERFSTRDMLDIQLDTVSLRARFWREQLLGAIEARTRTPEISALAAEVRHWNGRASPDSIGYRLIRSFRANCIANAYSAYVGRPGDDISQSSTEASAEEAMRRMLRERPPGLVPPGYHDWDDFLAKALDQLAHSVDEAPGGLKNFTWGRWMHGDIHHPLARVIPGLGMLTDPDDVPLPGDGGVPRAQYIGAGASERLAVSPGFERQGLFQMPGGQAGNPLASYYLEGHQDWVIGKAAPLLPGPAIWTLTMRPVPAAKHWISNLMNDH